jgi:hypothetical protein
MRLLAVEPAGMDGLIGRAGLGWSGKPSTLFYHINIFLFSV